MMTPDKQQLLEDIAKCERQLALLRDDLLMMQREERNRRGAIKDERRKRPKPEMWGVVE